MKSHSPGLVVAIVAFVVAMSGSAVAALPGPPGPQDQGGSQSPPTYQGPSGAVSLKYVQVTVNTPNFGPNTSEGYAAPAHCPAGQSVVGGGVKVSSASAMKVQGSRPFDSAADADTIPNNAWMAEVDVVTTASHSFTVYAICTTAASVG